MKPYIFRISVLALFLLFSIPTVQGQELDWTAQSDATTINGVVVNISATLEKQGGLLTLEQTSNDNVSMTQFTVVSESGNWNATTNEGDRTLVLSSDGDDASLQLQGANGQITILLVISNGTGSSEHFAFKINAITYPQ